MMFDIEGGYREKVRSYYLPGNTPAPPQEHRAYGSTSNAAEELINLTHLLFSARGGGAPPVEEGGYLLRLHGPPENNKWVKLISSSAALLVLPCARCAGGGAGVFPGR